MTTPQGDDYEFDCKVNEENFPYKDCRTMDMTLYGHEYLSLNYNYNKSFLSPEANYVAILGNSKDFKGKDEDCKDIVYIYNLLNTNKFKIMKKDRLINSVYFSPHEDSYVLVYEDKAPVYYALKSGKRIKKFKEAPSVEKNDAGKIICCGFSPNGKFFGIAYQNNFGVWDVLTGQLLVYYQIKSQLKFFSGSTLVSVTKDSKVLVHTISQVETKETPEAKEFPLQSGDYEISVNDILDGVVSKDGSRFIFATAEYVFTMNLSNGETQLKLEFDHEDIQKIFLSDDSDQVAATDLRNVYFYNIGENPQPIGTIYKENFKYLEVNFEKNMLGILDDICLNITHYDKEDEPEKFIWLDKNNEEFKNFSFSPDFEYILTITGKNRATVYETESGRVIRKWKNDVDDFTDCCIISPLESANAIIATKSSENEVKIWNYKNGNDICTLPDFNVASLCFDSKGEFLLGGAKSGNEMARAWNIKTGEYNSYRFEGENNNTNTKVLLTDFNNKKLNEESQIVIAVSEEQNPVVFYFETLQPAYECKDCPVKFKKVEDIQSNKESNVFFVKGIDLDNNYHAVVFNLENGKLLWHFKNCNNIALCKEKKMLLAKCDNQNDKKLFVMKLDNIDDTENPEIVDCKLEADVSNFIQGGQAIVSSFGDGKIVSYILNNPETGEVIGELKITRKNEQAVCEMDISAQVDDTDDGLVLIFRYIKLSDQEYNPLL